MTQRHRRLPSDASALSFAVIYDPEKGLQSFTEPVLSAYDEPMANSAVYHPQGEEVGNKHLESLDSPKRQPFTLFGRWGPEKHVLNIRTSSLFEKTTRGEEIRASSPAPSDFSQSIYSQESGTDESAGTYTAPRQAPAPILSQPKTTDSKAILRPKMSFKMPSFYGRVSLYRKKPTKSAASVKPDGSSSPQAKSADASAREECSAGPKLYTLLHRVHNASCSGESHTADTACCDSNMGDLRATDHVPFDDSEKSRPLQACTEEYASYEDKYDVQVAGSQETWSDFEYDPRLPSRFSVTTTSTSTYVEINMEALSFDDSVRCYSAPFDDVHVYEAPSPSNSPFGSPKRMRNPWRPKI